jgi:hypothetical protein
MHGHATIVKLRVGSYWNLVQVQSWYAGVKYRRQDCGFLRNLALDKVTPVKYMSKLKTSGYFLKYHHT